MTQAWPLIGSTVVGLNFDTTNSALLAEALINWWSALLHGLRDFLKTLRTIASAGTIPTPRFPAYDVTGCCVWLRRSPDSGFAGGHSRLCLATLVWQQCYSPSASPFPRTAFFAYPAIYLLAAAGLANVVQVNREVWHHLSPKRVVRTLSVR